MKVLPVVALLAKEILEVRDDYAGPREFCQLLWTGAARCGPPQLKRILPGAPNWGCTEGSVLNRVSVTGRVGTASVRGNPSVTSRCGPTDRASRVTSPQKPRHFRFGWVPIISTADGDR